MDYKQALEYIYSISRFSSKLGLDNIKYLLECMENPQNKLKCIHVAGTNGKGSTTAIIANILKQQGYKVGMFISPFIEEFTERIQINGIHIDKQCFAEIVTRIKQLIKEMERKGYSHPTQFEIITAAAFEYYYQNKCDFVVVEVGLGGRLDATNVIKNPLISVITSISFDHIKILGDTISKIAFEKCGIIKKNGTVVVYPKQQKDAANVIKKVCEDKCAEIINVDTSSLKVISNTIEGIRFNYREHLDFVMHLLGNHQIYNALTALTVIKVLIYKYNIDISLNNIKEGLKNTKWPARFEILSKNPLLIIDGAHNVSGIRALKDCIDVYLKGKKIVLIMGMLKDKEYEKCVQEIVQVVETFIATYPCNPRAIKGEELIKIAQKQCLNTYVENDIERALLLGLRKIKDDAVLCCCGSLYLASDIRRIFGKFIE